MGPPPTQQLLVSICVTSISLFFLFGVILTLRAFSLQAPPDEKGCEPSDADFIELTEERLKRFQLGLQKETVSQDVGVFDREELYALQQFIIKSYPLIHSSPHIKYESVANYSMLYTVKGTNPRLTPYMLCGHMDVVPPTAGDWDADPFSGEVLDGFIYGRGAIDAKQLVFGILEALEFQLQIGYRPKRSFYVAFGHDEEARGEFGAKAIGRTLLDQGAEDLLYILDEGLTVTSGIVPGVESPVGIIGVSEKGDLTVQLSVNLTGGHSSMPDKDSSIEVLARAVTRLIENPQPSMFGNGPEYAMLESLAPKMAFHQRLIMGNLWLFAPLVSWSMSGAPTTNALIRTTTAVTAFNSGIKHNVIPPAATAIVNHRIHPAQTMDQIMSYDHKVINDKRVKMDVLQGNPALPVSPSGSHVFGYEMISQSIRQIWSKEKVTVVPGLMVGGTDTKHYLKLSPNIYRFSPTFMYPDDVPRFHGLNERISLVNYEQAINFYHHLITNCDREKLSKPHAHTGEL